MQGHDKMITRRASHGPGVELVDGASSGPPYLSRINDPRNTSLRANVELTPGGWLQVIQNNIPPFDLSKGVDQNARAELRFDYGDEFWSAMTRLGTSSEHAIEVD
jgi:hypothetical protein